MELEDLTKALPIVDSIVSIVVGIAQIVGFAIKWFAEQQENKILIGYS